MNVGWLNKDGSISIRREYGEDLPISEQISLCTKWIESIEEEKAELWREMEDWTLYTDGELND